MAQPAAQNTLQQIQTLLDRLVQIQLDQTIRTATDKDKRVETIVRNLIDQTTKCDGASVGAVRRWIKDIQIAFEQVDQPFIVRIVTSTVSGTLRYEIEHYLSSRAHDDNLQRHQVPWQDIRDYIYIYCQSSRGKD